MVSEYVPVPEVKKSHLASFRDYFLSYSSYFVAKKYCSLVEQEGGLLLLEELINSNVPKVPYQRVIELASIVRDNVTKWKEGKRANHDNR